MGGIENNLEGGLFNFKSKFNPTIEEFAGEFNYPTSSLYFLFNIAYKIRKKLRSRQDELIICYYIKFLKISYQNISAVYVEMF